MSKSAHSIFLINGYRVKTLPYSILLIPHFELFSPVHSYACTQFAFFGFTQYTFVNKSAFATHRNGIVRFELA